MDKQDRSSADKYLRDVSGTQRRMIHETRSQKSGPTAGVKRADLQLARKSTATSRRKEHAKQQEEKCQQQARTRTSPGVTKVART